MTTPDIDTYVAERRALLEAATEDQWFSEPGTADDMACIHAVADNEANSVWVTDGEVFVHDADLIVATRNDEERQLAVIEAANWIYHTLNWTLEPMAESMLGVALDALLAGEAK